MLNSSSYNSENVSLYCGNSLDFYVNWPTPMVIISDGAYGIDGFEGDLGSCELLADWYEPHVAQWTKYSGSYTTIWVFNTEVGWANIHPVLKRHGWKYVRCCIWNKGMGHVVGRVNSSTIKQFPCVSEVAVQYVRKTIGNILIENPLREEWNRTGLPLREANKACGVKAAAVRKYLSSDSQFYIPTGENLRRLKEYANQFGNPEGKPYFTDEVMSRAEITINQTKQMVNDRLPKFNCPIGLTNIWNIPHLSGAERIRDKSGTNSHPNQKPLQLMDLIIKSSSDEGDVIWEPFGGLFTACLAGSRSGRELPPP